MNHPMMKCGHAANAVNGKGEPSCVICAGLTPDADVVANEPSFGERLAKCSCGKTQPSSDRARLAFFEFRGEGSPAAMAHCKHCGYYEVAHNTGKPHLKGNVCEHFEPHGAYDFDLFYCGCRGWD